MDKEAMGRKLEELLQSEEFSGQITRATSFGEIVEILGANGIETTEDELRAFGEEGIAILKEDGYISEDGELSEEMLEQVAGGLGGKVMLAGAGMVGVALASDYLAGACAVALVSNPIGWFMGGIAVTMLGAHILSKEIRKRKK